ncbi:unnamed protein product, partial [Effrenium voratum]
ICSVCSSVCPPASFLNQGRSHIARTACAAADDRSHSGSGKYPDCPAKNAARPSKYPRSTMGAYKYLEEMWRKKQSDVMRFLARLRNWEFRQLPAVHRCSRPTRPDKA